MNIKACILRIFGYKTVEEMFDDENKGKAVGRKAIENAVYFSTALMPKGLFYPKGGEVFEAIHDVTISYQTHFMAPYTGGDKAMLMKGERIIIGKPGKEKPLGYYAYPTHAEEVEARMIPSSDKNDPTYNGFSLSVDTISLNKNFKQIALKPLIFLKGEATHPIDNRTKIIVHICNDVGGWGKGFVLAISKRWLTPEIEYRNWYKNIVAEPTETILFERLERRDKYSDEKKFELGNVQFVKVTEDIWVANMIAQRDIRPDTNGLPPIRYVFVSEGLERVRHFAQRQNASVHMPRIGCGLAGGHWTEIEEIIHQQLIAYDIETSVYDLNKESE